ncbi:hypothetical protein ACTJJ0_03075 [Chitinophaga sp. 22321]|uniref:DUF4142 domain-containing protein n=1 Tax=Chitinophaga hostae TaxID=2831022 RepID=A0ABS5JA87_9BACT|nr:hypothetical protein [Chitinophaga hostae]MBS0032118.1 hypothetical protein [Chitinophaga hostae]
MKQPILIAVLLLTGLASCKPRKAIEFKKVIEQQERNAIKILISEGSLEEEKLNCLVKLDFKGAAIAVDKQEKAFDSILKDITTLPADGIKEGDALKTAASNYYSALKVLHLIDRKEIEQRVASYDKDPDIVRLAQDSLLQLTRESLDLNRKAQEEGAVLHEAMNRFDMANGL